MGAAVDRAVTAICLDLSPTKLHPLSSPTGIQTCSNHGIFPGYVCRIVFLSLGLRKKLALRKKCVELSGWQAGASSWLHMQRWFRVLGSWGAGCGLRACEAACGAGEPLAQTPFTLPPRVPHGGAAFLILEFQPLAG